MKSLKYCIKDCINENYLNESAWDIEDNIADDNEELILDIIRKFIEKNYNGSVFRGKPTYQITKKGDKYFVDCKSSLTVQFNDFEYLTNEYFEFNSTVNLQINNCDNLKSLEGGPKIVKRVLEITECKTLKDLSYAPQECYCIYVGDCDGLKSIKGIPNTKDVDIERCKNLEDIKDLPSNLKRLGLSALESLKDINDIPDSCEEINIFGCNSIEMPTKLPKKLKYLNLYDNYLDVNELKKLTNAKITARSRK